MTTKYKHFTLTDAQVAIICDKVQSASGQMPDIKNRQPIQTVLHTDDVSQASMIDTLKKQNCLLVGMAAGDDDNDWAYLMALPSSDLTMNGGDLRVDRACMLSEATAEQYSVKNDQDQVLYFPTFWRAHAYMSGYGFGRMHHFKQSQSVEEFKEFTKKLKMKHPTLGEDFKFTIQTGTEADRKDDWNSKNHLGVIERIREIQGDLFLSGFAMADRKFRSGKIDFSSVDEGVLSLRMVANDERCLNLVFDFVNWKCHLDDDGEISVMEKNDEGASNGFDLMISIYTMVCLSSISPMIKVDKKSLLNDRAAVPVDGESVPPGVTLH